jgi:hypothetical protein
VLPQEYTKENSSINCLHRAVFLEELKVHLISPQNTALLWDPVVRCSIQNNPPPADVFSLIKLIHTTQPHLTKIEVYIRWDLGFSRRYEDNRLLRTWSLWLIHHHDDGGGRHLWKVGELLPNCTVQHPSRPLMFTLFFHLNLCLKNGLLSSGIPTKNL